MQRPHVPPDAVALHLPSSGVTSDWRWNAVSRGHRESSRSESNHLMSREDEFAVALRELLASLRSEPAEAATTAAALLELNSFPVVPSTDDLSYERLLPAALMERELRQDEELRVVDELHRLIVESSNKREHDRSARSGLIYALGRSNPRVGVQKILDILVNHRASLSIGEFHQCVHSLQRCLDLPEDHSRYSVVVSALEQLSPTPVLEATAAVPLELDHEMECLPRDIEFVLRQIRRSASNPDSESSANGTQTLE